MPTVLHVATTGSDSAEGSQTRPLRTISRAAELALPGQSVVVHQGEYREWVRPRRGGLSNTRRITYQAADGEHVVIKGSERVTGWEREDGSVWRVQIPHTLFGTFNPFAEEIAGDWTVRPGPGDPPRHLGDVYLDGVSFFEVSSRAKVSDPPQRTQVIDDWTQMHDPIDDPDRTQRVWYAEVGAEHTTLWAHFANADPNTSLTEINVRPAVFFPTDHHINYITVRGFELAHAASPWTPPTADQPGLIGPNWAKGWIIEDNHIHDAKCSAISIGKEASTGHNDSMHRGDKPGYQYQLESVFKARHIGWDKEHIGSHIIRRNHIHDCGQNGIVGHLGCAFSIIEDNHIHDIARKREFYGYEIGGIKLHAAIDVQIRKNRIHGCSLGTWLDWQTQGTRVSQNIYYDNSRDLFIEVSHGPYIVDHNILASRVSLDSFSQGGAFVNNLLCGAVRLEDVKDRATPYHVPHSTQVAGFAVIFAGDDRWVGNLFLGGDLDAAYLPGGTGHSRSTHGTAGYDEHPASFEEYLARLEEVPPGDHEKFWNVRQAVYIRNNAYGAGALAYAKESDPHLLQGPASAVVVDSEDGVHLEITLPPGFARATAGVTSGADLERVRIVDADFEETDGSIARMDTDLLGIAKKADRRYPVGPFAELGAGTSHLRLR